MTPKISACLIVRDEEATLEECLKSIRPHVDELVVVDTGSVDGSPEIARKYADVFDVFLDCNDVNTGLIEDFASARNRSFELASHEWVFWCDGDDIVVGAENLRRLAAEAQHDNVLYLFPYEYSFAPDGTCIDLHFRERLMRPRHKLEWRFPVHEGCLFREVEGSMFQAHDESVRIIHRSQQSTKPREPGRNLRILKKYVDRVGESEPRALFYLGREYAHQGDLGSAIRLLRRYIELSKWDDERCCAQLELAKHYRTMGDHDSAIEWSFKAMGTKAWADPYWSLARSYYCLADMGVNPEYNYRRCAHFATLGLSLKHDGAPETILFNNPRARFEIHQFLNVALSRLGDLDGAIASCEAGLQGIPDDAWMLKNLPLYRAERSKRTVVRESEALAGAGVLGAAHVAVIKEIINGNIKVVPVARGTDVSQAMVESAMLSGIGEVVGLHGAGGDGRGDSTHDAAGGAGIAALSGGRPREGCLDVVFFLGEALETWSPVTFSQTGLGGSETMAWEMSKRLAKLGHRVRLFGHCTPTMHGVYDGVEYLDGSRFRNLTCDVLISSRRPDAVDDAYGVKSGCRVLWVHDLHCGEALTMPRVLRFDRILCLSNWHREFFLAAYRGLDPAKVLVTRNGVDMSRFDIKGITRNPHKAIFSSSPDRGLQTALDCWPRIRKEVPDAELHVFYGWFNWEQSSRLRNDEPALKSIRYLRHLAQTTKGVVVRDRVNQRELAREMLSAGVWAYSTWFQETSCISAMEAQAAGLRIVTSPIAALTETVGERGKMIGKGEPDEWRSPEYFDAFTKAVVEAMTLPEDEAWPSYRDASLARTQLQHYARENFCLDKLADDWSQMLADIHRDVSERVVPPFHHAEVA